MEKNIFSLDLVVVVIASACLLFILGFFYFIDNNVYMSPRNICIWVVSMDFTSWVFVLVFLCKKQ